MKKEIVISRSPDNSRKPTINKRTNTHTDKRTVRQKFRPSPLRARKCFVSYVRSVFLQRDKSVFQVEQLPLAAYAASLGLLTAPKVRFLKKATKKRGDNQVNT